MNNNYIIEYYKWLNNKSLDDKSKDLLLKMDLNEIEDSFYKKLTLGTAGMRGIIGVGTNRFNIYTLRRANYGYAKFLISSKKDNITVVIARDNRLYGKEFVEECVKVLSIFNIKCYVFDEITPTPVLSYAIRYLKADGGIVITASHNPKEYSGYKIYDNIGCQLTPKYSNIVEKEVDGAPDYFDIQVNEYDYCLKNNFVLNIDNNLINSYINDVKSIVIKNDLDNSKFKLTISPLHGTGGKISCQLLDDLGYQYCKVIEQFDNNPSFPTVHTPNPEDEGALSLSIDYAKKYNCDICLATDPDSDRIGIAVRDIYGDYKLLNGNQIGAILIYYLAQNKNLTEHYFIDTLVSSRLTRKIALINNMNIITTYTGFKFISQQVEYLALNNKKFAFAYEESYGYLLKDIVRDKDSFQPLIILTEIACYYKNQGINLIQLLDEIYNKYGYYKEELLSFTFDGIDGKEKMDELINELKYNDNISFDNLSIENKVDYSLNDLIINDINLFKSDIIEFNFKEDMYAIFRPSGTEPKFKVYIGANGLNLDAVNYKIKIIKDAVLKIFNLK